LGKQKMNIIKLIFVLCILSSFTCLKEEARKWHPSCAVRLRRMPEVYAPYFGVLLAVAGTVKNSASPQTVLPSFHGNSSDAQRHRMGLQPLLLTKIYCHIMQQTNENGKKYNVLLLPNPSIQFQNIPFYLTRHDDFSIYPNQEGDTLAYFP